MVNGFLFNVNIKKDFKMEPGISKTNLIVNYLPPSMTQAEFVKMFQSVGEVSSFRLVKDKIGNSLGYGFVNYNDPEHAECAVKTLNGTQISNKTIKVSYARPEPPKGVNVYVSGLPATYGLYDLQKLFNPYGKIITTRLLLDDNKANGTGHTVHALGFVRYEERGDAERAIKDLNGLVPEGGKNCITVKLPSDNAKKLNASFAEFLTPKNHSVKKLPSVGGKTSVPINKGLNRFSPMSGPSNMISAEFHNPIAPHYHSADQTAGGHVIFVFGLHENTADSILWQLFTPYGPVLSAKIVRDDRNKCKGFGFVTMTNFTDATQAIHSLNGSIFGDKKLQVSFKQKKNYI